MLNNLSIVILSSPRRTGGPQVGPGFRPEMGCGAMPRPVRLAGQRLRRRPDKCDAGCRRHKLHITRFRRCRRRKLAHSAAPPSSRRNRFAGFRRELCWGGDKSSRFAFFRHFYVGVVSLTSGRCGCVGTTPRGVYFGRKTAFSEWVLCADGCVLFPPAHSAFSAFLHGGGITTLGVRFMPLKHWTRRSYGGVFVVFMPSRNSPCAG